MVLAKFSNLIFQISSHLSIYMIDDSERRRECEIKFCS